ncbi:hypothetical protein SRHO_G00108970 [Serrasalmus rhombeus]
MNSGEAAEEGPNDPDTEAFFKTGDARALFDTSTSSCQLLHSHTHLWIPNALRMPTLSSFIFPKPPKHAVKPQSIVVFIDV